MNDFANYECIFSNSFQSADLSTSMHFLEHDLSAPIHYFNAMSVELPSSQSQQTQHQQSLALPLISPGHPTQQQQGLTHGPTLNNSNSTDSLMSARHVTSTAINTSVQNSSAFGNIPFVQIHTTDVQPQRSNFGNSFRRSTANLQEIKSEPIKSENAEGSKERVNGTPTPPVRSTSSHSNSGERTVTPANTKVQHCVKNSTPSAVKDSSLVSSSTSAEGSNAVSTVQKCNQCAFISLEEHELQVHFSTMHGNNVFGSTETYRARLSCVGCENIFYAPNALFVHLHEDHLMSTSNAKTLLEAIQGSCNVGQKPLPEKGNIATDNTLKDVQRKSRIYLKNVECLREPQRESIGQEDNHNQISDKFFFENDCNNTNLMNVDDAAIMELLGTENIAMDRICSNSSTYTNNSAIETSATKEKGALNASKQKISIKSVDVLREPNLMRRDFDMQSFNNFTSNRSNDLQMHGVPTSEANQYHFTASSNEHTANTLPLNNSETSSTNNLEKHCEKPRKPKIYIRNVDILKEPMLLPNNLSVSDANNALGYNFMQPNLTQNTAQYLASSESLTATTQMYDANLSQLSLAGLTEPYLYEQTNNNYLTPNVNDLENYAFAGNNSNNNNYLLDNTCYATNELDCGLDSLHNSTTPIITEPTPPPSIAPAANGSVPAATVAEVTLPQKQKIFIKNVDVLKAPQFQEPRGTLHLRTVDELNLMNENEVQNLIAPNLDNTTGGGDGVNSSGSGSGSGYSTTTEQNTDLPVDLLYADGNCFKLHDFDAQVVATNWSDDYDLGEGLDCIITNATPLPQAQQSAAPKSMNDLDTPQVSLISIRDIEELTGSTQQTQALCDKDNTNNNLAASAGVTGATAGAAESETHNRNSTAPPIAGAKRQETEHFNSSIATSGLKQQRGACVPNAAIAIAITTSSHSERTINIAKTTTASSFIDMPPLVPVTTTAADASVMAVKEHTTRINTSSIPVPPLVPVSPLIQLNVSTARILQASVSKTTTSAPSTITLAPSAPSATEKARIYVANNLLQTSTAPKPPVAITIIGGTSVRGRPFGAKRAGVAKVTKLLETRTAEMQVGLKCSIQGCAFRFKKPETLEYHRKCHINDSNSNASQAAMLCPECKSTDFTNWNTLHTHLWRSHEIDMELYRCELCTFKTPIYSRLINTHSKIHYEDRNYKCDQCEKAFKNTKQLKNHRRWHRTHCPSTAGDQALSGSEESMSLHRCAECGAVFSHQKSLREHNCKGSASQVKCQVCARAVSSKSALKLHMLTHEAVKRFKCANCQYTSNDHNAFRRHKMTHENAKMYVCPHCSYKSIQSVAYQKHVQQKHPDIASAIIHKCLFCPYSTINRALFTVHQAKHGGPIKPPAPQARNSTGYSNEVLAIQPLAYCTDDSRNPVDPTADTAKNKIKVKSNLVLTDTTKLSIDNGLHANATIVPIFEAAVT